MKTVVVGGTVRCVAWCPNPALSLVAVAADRKCLLINPGVGDHLVVEKTDSVLAEPPVQDGQSEYLISQPNRTMLHYFLMKSLAHFL